MRRFITNLAVAATAAALAVAAPSSSATTAGSVAASTHHVRARVIATFGTAESFAESATLDGKGRAIVSVTRWGPIGQDGVSADNIGQLYVVSPSGHKKKFGPAINLGGCGMLLGVDLDARGNAVVAVFNFGPDPACVTYTPPSGLLRVTRTSWKQLTTLPAGVWPNGVEVVGRKVYVTDSLGGTVWKAPASRVTTQHEPWLASPLLTPGEDPEFALGADGVAYRNGSLWLTSYGRGLIVRVPVRRNGHAGKPVVVASGKRLVGADGIAFDKHGVLWVAVTHSKLANGTTDKGHIVTVSRRGTVRTKAFAEGHLNYPTQPLVLSRSRLLVVNGAYLTGNPDVTLFTR